VQLRGGSAPDGGLRNAPYEADEDGLGESERECEQDVPGIDPDALNQVGLVQEKSDHARRSAFYELSDEEGHELPSLSTERP
jgi:hypothetical protein